jgi:hypothetical protein
MEWIGKRINMKRIAWHEMALKRINIKRMTWNEMAWNGIEKNWNVKSNF